METENYFHLNVIGQIESAYFPLPSGNLSLYCRFDIVCGPDWELVSGIKSGVTQNASSGRDPSVIVFNMPLEFTFKSTNPFGWPQIVFSFFGKNMWGAEISKGYARVHIPLCGELRECNAPILIPKCSNAWAALVSWITDKNPELKDAKILCDGAKIKNIMTESQGKLLINLQSVSRGAAKMNLIWNEKS